MNASICFPRDVINLAYRKVVYLNYSVFLIWEENHFLGFILDEILPRRNFYSEAALREILFKLPLLGLNSAEISLVWFIMQSQWENEAYEGFITKRKTSALLQKWVGLNPAVMWMITDTSLSTCQLEPLHNWSWFKYSLCSAVHLEIMHRVDVLEETLSIYNSFSKNMKHHIIIIDIYQW